MDNWAIDSADVEGRYAPGCSSRAAEGFYSGALLGAVWGIIGHSSYPDSKTPSVPQESTTSKTASAGPLHASKGVMEGAGRHFRTLGRGVAGYTFSAVSTGGVFGVFVGVLNAGTCTCQQLRGKQDWMNNAFGGGLAGFSVAMLSRHTRSPRILGSYAVGGAAITSVVEMATSLSVSNRHER